MAIYISITNSHADTLGKLVKKIKKSKVIRTNCIFPEGNLNHMKIGSREMVLKLRFDKDTKYLNHSMMLNWDPQTNKPAFNSRDVRNINYFNYSSILNSILQECRKTTYD